MYTNHKSTLQTNPCFKEYIGNVLLELNGKLDLSVDGSTEGVKCEIDAYQGPECEQTRVSYAVQVLRMWKQIYDNGLKHDITFIDNSSASFYAQNFEVIRKEMEYTTGWMIHYNINPLPFMQKYGGEKSGLLLPYKFMIGGMADNMGYDAIIHSNAKYTPIVDYRWKEVVSDFIDSDLELLITPSRYGKRGFNHNCMIVKPRLWRLWSRTWVYRPERLNTDLLDCWESLKQLHLVDGDDVEPYRYVDKKRMHLWLDCPFDWYRKTKAVDYKETVQGYKIIR